LKRHGLWIDELDWTLRIINGNNFLELFKELARFGYNLPLYYFIIAVINVVSKNNEFILLLVSAIMSIIGCYYIYKTSKEIFEEDFSKLTILFITGSLFFYKDITCLIRPYSLLYMLSALSIYYYLKKLKTNTTKNIIIYYMIITGLVLTHWFGNLIVFFYGISDLYLFIKRKIKFKDFILYIIPFIFIMSWLIYVFNVHTISFSNYWPEKPDLSRILFLLFELLGFNLISICFLFIITKFILCKNIEKNNDYNIAKTILVEIIVLIAGVFTYSRFINPKGSLWVERYFIAIMPQFIIASAFFFKKLYDIAMTNITNRKNRIILNTIIISSIAGSIAFTFFCSYLYPGATTIPPYEKIYKSLEKKEDIYDKDTLIICSFGKYWVDYYLLERENKELPANIAVIDPYKYGNTNSNPAKVFELEYVIRNFNITDENFETVGKYDYKKIYIINIYRKFKGNELLKLIDLKNYDYYYNYDYDNCILEIFRNED
jgi:hypothetical protein